MRREAAALHIESTSGFLFATRQMRTHDGAMTKALQQMADSQSTVSKGRQADERVLSARRQELAMLAAQDSVARGGAGEIASLLDEMIEVASRMSSGLLSGEEAAELQARMDGYMEEIGRVVNATRYEDKPLLDKPVIAQVKLPGEGEKAKQPIEQEKPVYEAAAGPALDLEDRGETARLASAVKPDALPEETPPEPGLEVDFDTAYRQALDAVGEDLHNLGDAVRLLQGTGVSVATQADAARTLENLTMMRKAVGSWAHPDGAGDIGDHRLLKLDEQMTEERAAAREAAEETKMAKANVNFVRAQVQMLGSQLVLSHFRQDSENMVSFLQQMV